MPELQPLPHRNSPDYYAIAEANMAPFRSAAEEFVAIVQGQVVDEETRRMAYDVHPAFINRGVHVVAFGVNPNGSQDREHSSHVMTVPYQHVAPSDPAWKSPAREIALRQNEYTRRMTALRRSHGVKGLIQLAAGDPETGVIVTVRAAGKHLSTMTQDGEKVPSLTHRDLRQLKKTARSMAIRGVKWSDPHDENFMYDPHDGVTLLDIRKGRRRPGKVVQHVQEEFRIQQQHQQKSPSEIEYI